MRKKLHLLLGLAVSVAATSNAQKLQTNYIEWPSSAGLPGYIEKWNAGTPLFEDENFFISRVKPKKQIDRNPATQIYENINNSNDKRLLFWVPVGNAKLDGVHTDALPNGLFDSEVFSLWSYVDHFGDWISPFGWVPASFADAAHKHGVAVSGVASIPNASLSGDWLNCLREMGKLDASKVGDFLLYHGVNGLAYNSEYGGASSVQPALRALHVGLNKYMADKDPLFENIAYDGVSDAGSIAFSERLCANNKKNFGSADEKACNFFLNYNWNLESYIAESERYCEELGRPMSDLYAGMNMQGGCKTYTEWQRHLTCGYSIGLWGAHDFNYLWAPRAQEGSSDDAKQRTYQKLQEWWFTNGQRNPAAKMEVGQTKSLSANESFFGISRFKAAKSTLGWNLDDEPFVTYFNLGNGKFFNYRGERQNNNEWYNIGVQDYMPTWRFWFADAFLGKEPSNIPQVGLNAEFTWDEAYFGGSSLRVKGSVADEYLHLFKTSFEMATNDVIAVRYKLLSGKADVSLALSVEGEESEIIRESSFRLLSVGDDIDDDGWIVKEFKINGPNARPFTGKRLAMIALHFENADAIDLCLGELSIRRAATPTPAKPIITSAKALAYSHTGADAKVIFKMANNKTGNEPCYNSDVNTALFTLWAQQQGCEPIMVGATTSWAAICYRIPMDADAPAKYRVGVQAVAMDMLSESEIAWSDYLEAGDYDLSHEVAISKNTIKPGESFSLSFVDARHPEGMWEISDAEGGVVASGVGRTFECKGIDKLGTYNVVADKGGENEQLYPGMFMVTAWERGAIPQIDKLSVEGRDYADGDDAVSISSGDELCLSYNGRRADGSASQGIRINEHFVGFKLGDLGLEAGKTFAVGAWLKFDTPAGASRLIAIEDRQGSWPLNNWGWLWSSMGTDGTFDLIFRQEGKANQPLGVNYKFDEKIPFNTWFHLVVTCEYNGNKFRSKLFMNGKQLTPSKVTAGATDLTSDNPDDWWFSSSYFASQNDWLAIGGGAGSSPIYNDGVIDELVVWNTPVTEADVKKSMEGFADDTLPENVLCYWSMEKKAESDNTFLSEGSLSGKKASCFELITIEGEGSGIQWPTLPIYTSGCPTLDKKGFVVETKPTWSAKRASILEASGSDTEGSAKMEFKKGGDYTVRLTLENVLGKDERDYPVIRATTSIEAPDGGEQMSVYAVDDAVVVDFVESGDYKVEIYDIMGACVASRSQNFGSEGGRMFVSLNRGGVYLVKIVKNGALSRTVKLMKK